MVRFEAGLGEQAQADWIESKHLDEHEDGWSEMNGFIYVLGYSRWIHSSARSANRHPKSPRGVLEELNVVAAEVSDDSSS